METKEKKYEVVIEEITPEKAQEMLRRNPFNRQVRESSVYHFVFQMKNGLWKENACQPIAFDRDGNLLNGQHRLSAVVKAGIPVRMAVMYGANKEDFIVIDTGRPRGVADALYIQGVKHNTAVAGIIRAYWQLKKSTFDTHSKILGLTSEIAYQEYIQSPDLYDNVVRMACRVYSNTRLLNISEMGGICMYLIKERHHTFEEVEQFFIELTSGAKYNVTKQLRLMIFRSLNAPTYKQKMTPVVRRALIAKAWNAYITGIDVKRLVYKPDDKVIWM